MLSKRCPRCKLDKSLDEFGAHRGKPFDKAIWRRACARECDHKRRSDPAVRAQMASKARERRRRPEVKARIAIYDAEYCARNPELRRRLNNSPTKRARDRERSRTPEGRERAELVVERRRARLASVPSTLTASEWDAIKDRFNNLCAYCLCSGDLQIEHLQPIALGDAHALENVVPACRPCNQRKNRRDLVQFLAYSTRKGVA